MPSDIKRVFLDTNVWFSAFYGSANCEKLIQAHLRGKITAVVSQQVIEELIRNFREKAPHLLDNFKEVILISPPEIIVDPKSLNPKIRNLVEGKDQPIFCSALMAKVDYFVTGNIKDFNVTELKRRTGISLLTPKHAVKTLGL